VAGAVWAVLWYGLVLLAFGIAPTFPPSVAVGAGLLVALGAWFFLPRWSAHSAWNQRHTYAGVTGPIAGSMLVSFVGFIGALPPDLGFKILVDLLAAWFLVVLGRRVYTQPAKESPPPIAES
jgi:ABC-type phosphate transport system permease subunit